MSCFLSLKHLFPPSFLFFSLFSCLPTPPPCGAFSLPLILLVHLSFYLSHLHFASLSNELKVLISSFFTYSSPLSSPFPCSFNPLTRPSHTCPLQLRNKSSVLSMQSQCYCPLISPTLRTNSSPFQPFSQNKLCIRELSLCPTSYFM